MTRTNQEEYVFGNILLLANKMQAWGDDLLEELTLKQWFLLLLISKMDTENPNIKEIADFSGTSRQNTKKILEQLEKNRFVIISKSETDARAFNVSLSDKTWEFFSVNKQKAADSLNGLFADISNEELCVTQRTLEKLLTLLGEISD